MYGDMKLNAVRRLGLAGIGEKWETIGARKEGDLGRIARTRTDTILFSSNEHNVMEGSRIAAETQRKKT